MLLWRMLLKSKHAKDARVAKPVLLYWVYVTAWPTPDETGRFATSSDPMGATGGQEVGLELQTTHPTSEDQDVEARSH
jgi:hypothetical protein